MYNVVVKLVKSRKKKEKKIVWDIILYICILNVKKDIYFVCFWLRKYYSKLFKNVVNI